MRPKETLKLKIGLFDRRKGEEEDEGSSQRQKEEEDQRATEGLLIEDEEKQSGGVKWNVFWEYMSSFGPLWYVYMILMLYAFTTIIQLYSNILLSKYTDGVNENKADKASLLGMELTPIGFIILYSGVLLFATLMCAIKGILSAYGCAHASEEMHNSILRPLLHAPMSFFDTTPSGTLFVVVLNYIQIG